VCFAIGVCYSGAVAGGEPLPLTNTTKVAWSGTGQYRVLVTVIPRHLPANRQRDEMPARLKIDLAQVLKQCGVEGMPDLGRIQVIRYDAKTGRPIECKSFRGQGPYDIPYRFDDFDRRELCFLYDIAGNGHSGQLVWTHTQEGNAPANYAIYFDVVKPNEQSGESPIPLLGDGDALFTDQSDGFLITALHCKPTMCDWNGDGLLDLLIGETQGHIIYFENIGTKQEPKFARGRFLMLDDKPLRIPYSTTPCAVDWDDDGRLDLLVGREMGGQILFLQNVGTRTDPKLVLRGPIEADGKPIAIPAQLQSGESFLTQEYMCMPNVVDWNGDGYKDLLVGGYVSGAVFYFENVRHEKGIPKLVARGPISADGKVLRVGAAASPCVADFRGNGLLDLITARGNDVTGHGDPTGIAYFRNVGTSAQPELQEQPFPFAKPCHIGPIAVPVAADWNDDGLLDLVIGDYTHVRLYRNVGSRTNPLFEPALTLKDRWGPVQTGGFSTSPVDWNGDGNYDLAYSSGGVALKMNVDPRNPPRWKEAGLLTAAGQPINHVFPIGDSELFPLFVDFNGDGLPDLVLGVSDGYVWYYKNIGTREEPKLAQGYRFRLANGQFVKVGRYKEGDAPTDFSTHSGDRSCPKVADFNGDGLMDLMVSDAYGDVTYFENVGSKEDPVFAPGVKVLHESGERAMIAVADWDHDGRVDVILPLQDSIYLYRNVGKGHEQRFQRDRELIHQYIPYPNPYVVDWNHDGDEDLLVSSSYGVCYLFERSYIEGGYAEGTVIGVERRP